MVDSTTTTSGHRRRTFFAALIVVTALVLVACGDDGDSADGAESTDSSTTEDASTDSPDTTAETDDADEGADDSGDSDAGSGGDLVGMWTADAADTLAANTANVAMPAGINCTGPMTLDFRDDGTFTAGGTADCSAGGFNVTGTMNTTGNWATTGDGRVEITGATSDGSFDVPGIEIPPVDVVSDGSFAYSIEGDTLTVTFSDPNAGEVNQI